MLNPPAPPCGRCDDLLCLLRLSEIVIAGPEQASALRAMVDEIAGLARVGQARLAVSERGGAWLRCLAHRGVPGRAAHRTFADRAMPWELEALREHRVARGAAEGEIALPVLAGGRALGVLGLGLDGSTQPEAWDHELFGAAADLMALVLLGGQAALAPVGEPGGPSREPDPALTRRQRDVVFELVERGSSNERIGEALGLSARTVKIHLQAAYRELGVRNRGEAIRLVLTRHAGWLDRERGRRQNAGGAGRRT